jgi:hypothetical protein
MQRYYKDHYIKTIAELDADTRLFRAVIVITNVLATSELGTTLRYPPKGWVVTEGAAELYGLFFAKDWIDGVARM